MFDTTRGSTLILAAVMVVSIMGAPIAFSGPAAAATITTDRSLSQTQVGPGGTTTITTTVTVDSATSRMVVAERFSPEFDSVSITDVTFSAGSGSTTFQNAQGDGIDVALSSLEAGTTVEITYEATVSGSASTGTAVNVTGTITAGDQEVSIGADSLSIIRATSSRTIAEDSVDQGDSTTVTVEATVNQDEDTLSIVERFDPTFDSVSVDSVSVDGDGQVITQLAQSDGIDVAVSNLSAGTTVTVDYTVDVADDAAVNSTFHVTGKLSLAGDNVSTTGSTTVTVTKSVEETLAGDDKKVDTNDLRNAINHWATKKKVEGTGKTVETDDLRNLIRQWATGGTV